MRIALWVTVLVAAGCSSSAPAPSELGKPPEQSAAPAIEAAALPDEYIEFDRSERDDAPSYLFTIAPDGSAKAQVPGAYDCCATPSPDGSRILMPAFTDDHRVTTRIVNADGTPFSIVELPPGRLNLGPGAWLSNDQIAFEGWNDLDPQAEGIYVGAAAGDQGATRLTSSPRGMHDVPLSASPDGKNLLFLRAAIEDHGMAHEGLLFVTPVSGGHPLQLTAEGNHTSTHYLWGSPATWSPDGERIAMLSFEGTDSGNSWIDVVDVDGGGVHKVAPEADPYSGAMWSPDGEWILADRRSTAGGAELILVHPDGSDLKAVGNEFACCGAWSPDGSRILYLRSHSMEDGDLYISDIDGSNETQLTDDPGLYQGYSWVTSADR